MPAPASIVYAYRDQRGKQSQEVASNRKKRLTNDHHTPLIGIIAPASLSRNRCASESLKAAKPRWFLGFWGGLVATHGYVRISITVTAGSAQHDGMRRIGDG